MQQASKLNDCADPDGEESKNLSLAYTYTKDFLDQCNNQLDDLNSRLTTFLGFGGLLLRFSLELPDGCKSCAWLKIIVIVLTTLSICLSSYGLIANAVGEAVKPCTLMSDQWFSEKTNSEVKAKITNTWLIGLEQLEAAGKRKQNQLNYAIGLLGVAVAVFAMNAVIATVFSECS